MREVHQRRKRLGLRPTKGDTYKPEQEPVYWDFGDGRGSIEERQLTPAERQLAKMAKGMGR
jgi:hypothetical protein